MKQFISSTSFGVRLETMVSITCRIEDLKKSYFSYKNSKLSIFETKSEREHSLIIMRNVINRLTERYIRLHKSVDIDKILEEKRKNSPRIPEIKSVREKFFKK